MNDFLYIAKLIEALRPWLDHIVIVGGWAHRLHRFHALAQAPAYSALQTKDADVAIPIDVTLTGDISAALEKEGFVPELLGEHTPPVTHYWLDDKRRKFYAEFLVPLTGSGSKRDGTRDATVERVGVIAQKLRYLEILLLHPWTVTLNESVGIPLENDAEVLLPNPVSFITQKMLIKDLRPREKQPQDALYIHDTLELFGGKLDELRTIWLEQVRPALHPKTVSRVGLCLEQQFGSVTETLRAAARIRPDRQLDPKQVQRVCEYGLQAIIGE